jgi:hypothetical protein
MARRKPAPEILPLDEIRRRYPNRWLLISPTSYDAYGRATHGWVVADRMTERGIYDVFKRIVDDIRTGRRESIPLHLTGGVITDPRLLDDGEIHEIAKGSANVARAR